MEINKLARDLLQTFSWREKTLDADLTEIAEIGFVEADGCYFLAWGAWAENKRYHLAYQKRHPLAVTDEIGLECWVNSHAIHTPGRKDVFPQTMLFARQVLSVWKRQYPDKALLVIVSFVSPRDDLPFEQGNVKCHLIRPHQQWIGPDLEQVVQPIILLNSMTDEL